METRYCKYCKEPIPEKRRVDAKYCSNEHGYKYRNQQKRQENKEKSEKQRRLDKSYNIIKKLHRRGKIDVPTEALELMEFDFSLCTSIVHSDSETQTSVVEIFEFQLTFHGGRCRIKKL